MDLQTELKKTVAEILQTEPDEIGPDTHLRIRRLQGSIGSGILDAALRRRLGVSCPAVYSVTTYGELAAAVLGPEAPEAGPAAVQEHPPVENDGATRDGIAGDLACGIDLEMIENLPEAEDYWEADFYRTHFTNAEIAYCAAQENPRWHFAARWCAKEALKKCDPSFLHLDANQIEVVLDEFGKPWLRVNTGAEPRRVPAAVSLTETPVMAGAVVVLERHARSDRSAHSGTGD